MMCYGFHMVTESITSQVAEKVAAAILRSEKSKTAVALAAGIPSTTFTRKINGHADFTVNEIHAIATVLGTSSSALLPESFRAQAVA